jgi:hypothetical protein
MTDKEREERALEALIVSKLLPDCGAFDSTKLPDVPADVKPSLKAYRPEFIDFVIEKASQQEEQIEAETDVDCEEVKTAMGFNRALDIDERAREQIIKSRTELEGEFGQEEQSDGRRHNRKNG